MTERHPDFLPDDTRPDAPTIDGWSILTCPVCEHRVIALHASHLLHVTDYGHTVVPAGQTERPTP